MNKSTLQLIRLFIVLAGCFFFLFGALFYQQHKLQKEKVIYARKMQKIYFLMKENATTAQKMMASESEWLSALDYKEQAVQQMQHEMEECQVMLSELPEPPETMVEEYSTLLDVHIVYKQYMNLAISHQKEVSHSVAVKEEKLKSELNALLSNFEEMTRQQQEKRGEVVL
ncbi:hypothetical protein [Bacillus sp. REN10]|uniref:hypothetical protein n=1 Tax=Bacillus sp. REN10 TaxID=2782541 RepID=UPI00193BC0CE|nr:hypothetical protein [Bacillus sp. REN10]